MAEFYQVATGSKKISNLAIIDGISGSAVIPVVMSNIVGSSYPITNGTTNQISYQDFRESVIENNPNVFTTTQTVRVGGIDEKQTTLGGHILVMLTGSAGTPDPRTEGFRVELFANDGVKLYTFDNTEGTPENRFKTFMEVGTGDGDVIINRPLTASNDLKVLGDLEIGGAITIGQNLVVGGTITAQSYNSELISSSIIYESGSTKFGDTIDDRHERTGSLYISGSTFVAGDSSFAKNLGIGGNSIVAGNSTVNGVIINTLLSTVTSSLLTQNISQAGVNTLINAVTSSLITQNVSQNGVNTLINAVTTSLLAQTASQSGVNNLTLAVTSSLITQNTSQAGVNLGISIVTASLNAYTASGATSTSNINSFTASQLAVNNLTLAVTSSLITQNISQGLVNTLTQVVTASLITQNTSQGAVNLAISGVTASLITQNTSQGLVNTLTQAVTSSLITQNTSQGLVNNLTQAVTSSLITQNTSQGLVNTLTSAVTQSLINQNTSQGAVNLTISGVTASLINQNTSQGLVNTLTSAVTTSLINQNTSQGLVNNLTQAVTSSLITIVGGLQSYTASLKGAAIVSSSQQILNYNIFATTGSNEFVGNQTITGSFLVSGSTTQIGNNTLDGNTVLSGSISVSGSQLFIGTQTLSGSFLISGSTSQLGNNTLVGNNTITGSNSLLGNNIINGTNTIKGNTILSGSIEVSGSFTGSVDIAGDLNIASGSGFYRWGNKLFNYGQWASLETQSGSADTAYAMKMEVAVPEFEGIYVGNNGSGFPTRIYVENNGLYNIQFSAQLHTTSNESVDFSVWFAMTGSNIANSNTDFSIEKVSGGGFQVAALNFLTPISSGSYVELYWSKTTANGQLQYKGTQVSPTRPATPSVIVTVTQVA